MPSRLDAFSTRRLQKFIPEFRARTGQLPTRQDLVEAGFSESQLDAGIKDEVIELRYVTLTNGTILKSFVLK
jgi:hypothetical protein